MGGIRDYSNGVTNCMPWDWDQWYCKGIRDLVFRHNNKGVGSIVPLYPGLLTFSFLLFHVFFYLQIIFFYFLEFYTGEF